MYLKYEKQVIETATKTVFSATKTVPKIVNKTVKATRELTDDIIAEKIVKPKPKF